VRALAAVFAVLLLAGCTGSSGGTGGTVATDAPVVNPAEEEPTVELVPEEEATPELVLPKKYAKLNERNWKKVVKAPDKYTGKGYQIWACITQFDAATGEDAFRGDASFKKLKYWWEGANAYFTGEPRALGDIVKGDVVVMNVVGLGSLDYETQIGGNTTVPSFLVTKITRKGSCE
jgi:hypothetical protein